MKKKSILIVGNGLSAASLAAKALELGYKVIVWAKDLNGGLCEDYKTSSGVYVSKYGPHIFHTSNKEVWEYIHGFSDWIPYINSPLAEYRGRLYNLPINLHTLQQVYGTSNLEDIEKMLEEDRRYVTGEPTNARESAIKRVGRTIYEMFFKAYTMKQWGVGAEQLDPSILARVPLRLTWNNNYFNDLYQGLPAEGYTNFIRKLFKGVKAIPRNEGDTLEHVVSYVKPYKVFICEAPDKLFNYQFGYIPYKQTSFHTNMTIGHQAAVVNHNDFSTTATRTTNYALLWPTKRGEDVYVTEFPLNDHFKEEVKTEAYETKRCYPARQTGVYDQYAKFCKEKGYILCGRLAENKYLDMDKAILNSWEKAKKYL